MNKEIEKLETVKSTIKNEKLIAEIDNKIKALKHNKVIMK